MNWTVAWKRACRDDLATLWLDSDLRAAITEAAHRIDSQLAKDPLAVGESRDHDRRVLIELQLGVSYKVKPTERKEIVIRVWRIS